MYSEQWHDCWGSDALNCGLAVRTPAVSLKHPACAKQHDAVSCEGAEVGARIVPPAPLFFSVAASPEM
jgi:hypothetical protein